VRPILFSLFQVVIVMVRCEDFYKKWQKAGNFCEKHPDTAARIQDYLEQLDEIASVATECQTEIADAPKVLDMISERACRPLIRVKDAAIRRQAIQQIVNLSTERTRAGQPARVTGNEVRAILRHDEPVPAQEDVLDQLYPASNEWDVPDLLLSQQPTGLAMPVNRWGTIARTKRIEGQTLHFYTDDYKFSGLWSDPLKLVNSGCSAIAEPNFSTNDNMPRAAILWLIYKKRWIARFCQDHGIRVWADLAIAPRHRDLALLGVPTGYRAYSTYCYTRDYDQEWIWQDYEQAKAHAGMDLAEGLLFWVYGGNTEVEKLAKENGWLWTPAYTQVFHKNISS